MAKQYTIKLNEKDKENLLFILNFATGEKMFGYDRIDVSTILKIKDQLEKNDEQEA